MKSKWISVSLVGMLFVLVAATIDLNNLVDYEAQVVPNYITRDNSANNFPSNEKSVLGRVLFYDKQLSLNNTIACASCHQQQFAFSDTAQTSVGFDGGLTDRHSMRLVNARFGQNERFFWDERAATLEAQTSQPIQNAVEMGFSGQGGQPNLDSLIRKMNQIAYYPTLFKFVYGDTVITEARIQTALSSFVRNLHSFDSKFDVGLAQTGNMMAPFSNYTADENAGKNLFLQPPGQGGAGCQACHRAPEFDIDPNILNNGVIEVANDPNAEDLTNFRAPTMRDIFNPQGVMNGPLMHNGKFTSMLMVVQHYNSIEEVNPQLDQHLKGPNNTGQNLNLTATQMNQLVAFMKTLSGNQLYTNPAYSDPFDANGNITVIPSTAGLGEVWQNQVRLYPNPFATQIQFDLATNAASLEVYDLTGKRVFSEVVGKTGTIPTSDWKSGVYLVRIQDQKTKIVYQTKVVKP